MLNPTKASLPEIEMAEFARLAVAEIAARAVAQNSQACLRDLPDLVAARRLRGSPKGASAASMWLG